MDRARCVGGGEHLEPHGHGRPQVIGMQVVGDRVAFHLARRQTEDVLDFALGAKDDAQFVEVLNDRRRSVE